MEEETDIISDIGIEHYDELDYEIKLEDNDEEEPITTRWTFFRSQA